MVRQVNHCLNTTLKKICEHALRLEALNESVLTYLPDTLQPHCKVASFSKGNLTISVSTPNYATELRFAIPQLREKLRREGQLYQLSSIKITVTESYDIKSKPLAQKLSPVAREVIDKEANAMEEGPLKNALKKLSREC